MTYNKTHGGTVKNVFRCVSISIVVAVIVIFAIEYFIW